MRRNCNLSEDRDVAKPSQSVDTTEIKDVQPLSPPNTAVQHI